MQVVQALIGHSSLAFFLILAIAYPPCKALNSQDGSRKVRLCGDRLVDAVLDLCNFKIYDPIEKRDIHVHDDSTHPPVLGAVGRSISSRFPLVVRRSEMVHIFKRRSADGGGGLATECCHNHCTIADMLDYCALDR